MGRLCGILNAHSSTAWRTRKVRKGLRRTAQLTESEAAGCVVGEGRRDKVSAGLGSLCHRFGTVRPGAGDTCELLPVPPSAA